MLRVSDVAEQLNISAQCVYQLIEAGKLLAHRFGVGRGTIRVSESDLEAYVESCKAKKPKVSNHRLKHIKMP